MESSLKELAGYRLARAEKCCRYLTVLLFFAMF